MEMVEPRKAKKGKNPGARRAAVNFKATCLVSQQWKMHITCVIMSW